MNKHNINLNQGPLNDHVNNNSNNINHEQRELESLSPKRVLVRATHEYVPVNNDELHIRPDDLITITNPEEGGWWEGTLGTKTGWFPSNYVVEERTIEGNGGGDITTQQADEYRRMILGELVESEGRFIAEMEEFYEGILVNITSAHNPRETETIKLLKQSYNAIIQTHKTHLFHPLQSHLNSTQSNPETLRVGKVFLSAAPQLETCHTRYCSLHPKFVQFVEMRNQDGVLIAGGDSMSVLRVIMCLSSPFRRVERFGGVLNELEAHVEGFHGDKGDLRRAVEYFRGLEKSLTSIRKQKEMELEVLTPGQIKEFEGSDISTLGDIILMNLVFVGKDKEPRYFVLFPTTILILAYDNNDNSFTYKGRVHVGGITVVSGVRGSANGEIIDEITSENCFEIAGPTLHPILIQCPSTKVKQQWLTSLNEVIRTARCYSTPPTPPAPPTSSSGQHHHHHSNSNILTPPPHPHHHSVQSSQQIFGALTPPVQAWNITRLRPSAPYNPFLAEYLLGGSVQKLGGSGRSSSGGSFGKGGVTSSTKSGSFSGLNTSNNNLSSVTNEDDFAVLSIVDGFCVKTGNSGGNNVLLRNDPSNRSIRSLDYNRVNNNIAHNNSSSRPPTSLPTITVPHNPPKPLPQLVKLLRDDITSLNDRISQLTRQLEEEKTARNQLINIILNQSAGGNNST